MSRVDIPLREEDFKNWITTFASVATVNATLLNLTGGQTTLLNAYATNFSNALQDVVDEKVVYKSKLAAKDSSREAANDLFRSTAKAINANPNVSDSLKANLGFSTSPAPASPVTPPSELTAVGYQNGVNKLKWKRNGNIGGTIFRIEARFGASLDWQFIDLTTETKFNHVGQTPGIQMTYRVSSQRAGLRSASSNFATVYPMSGESVVTLKAA